LALEEREELSQTQAETTDLLAVLHHSLLCLHLRVEQVVVVLTIQTMELEVLEALLVAMFHLHRVYKQPAQQEHKAQIRTQEIMCLEQQLFLEETVALEPELIPMERLAEQVAQDSW
jgi:hypothetical protein